MWDGSSQMTDVDDVGSIFSQSNTLTETLHLTKAVYEIDVCKPGKMEMIMIFNELKNSNKIGAAT